MIPLFYIYNLYRIYDTYIGLILLHTIGAAPFAAWLMRGYIDTIPRELEDAAVIDGCSRGQATRRIIAPLAAPGMAAVAVLAFRRAWGDFAGAIMLTSSRAIQPYTTVLYSFVSEHKVQWGRLSAAAFISTIPIVIIFTFFQKYFVSGLTAGAVKD
jgi:ABC-type glycerol-3-phosphate transport system permease component